MLLRSLVGIALTSSVRENISLEGKTLALPFFAQDDARFGCVVLSHYSYMHNCSLHCMTVTRDYYPLKKCTLYIKGHAVTWYYPLRIAYRPTPRNGNRGLSKHNYCMLGPEKFYPMHYCTILQSALIFECVIALLRINKSYSMSSAHRPRMYMLIITH
jgi:hypothetical protein